MANALWSENQTVPVSDGLFNVNLGATQPITPALFAQQLWLGVEVAGDGEMTPRQELTGAPYAMSLVAANDYYGVRAESEEGDGVFGCALRYVGLNAADAPLQPGDTVTAAGVAALAGMSPPVMEVAPVTAGKTLLGVVAGRVEMFMVDVGSDDAQPGAH